MKYNYVFIKYNDTIRNNVEVQGDIQRISLLNECSRKVDKDDENFQ